MLDASRCSSRFTGEIDINEELNLLIFWKSKHIYKFRTIREIVFSIFFKFVCKLRAIDETLTFFTKAKGYHRAWNDMFRIRMSE